jgi:hypothetical protein
MSKQQWTRLNNTLYVYIYPDNMIYIYGDWFIYIYSYNFNIYLFTDQDPDLEADPGVVPGQKVVHDLKVQEVVVKAIQNPDQDLDRNKKECVILDQSHSKLHRRC